MLVGMDHTANIPEAVPKASTDPLPEISAFLMPFALFVAPRAVTPWSATSLGLLTDLIARTATPSLRHWQALQPSACNICLPMPIGTPKSSMALASDPWVREVLEVACWS